MLSLIRRIAIYLLNSVIHPLYNWVQGNNDAKQGNLSRKLATVESFKVDEGLTLEKSALKLFTVTNLPYQLSRLYQITLLYSPTDAVPQRL